MNAHTNQARDYTRYLILALSPLFSAFGQNAAKESQAPRAKEPERVVTLDAFTVKSDAVVGYRANETAGASLIAVNIADLPVSIATITPEFMKDMQVKFVEEAVQYVSGVSNQGRTPSGASAFNIRGFNARTIMRNGVKFSTRPETSTIESVEVIRGPQSLVFGAADPGGMINYTTKQPRGQRDFTKLSLTAGSYDFWRAEFDINKAIMPKNDRLLFRVSGNVDNTESNIAFMKIRSTTINPVLAYQPTSRTRLTFDFSYDDRRGNWVFTALPLFTGTTRALVPVDPDFSSISPNTFSNQRSYFRSIKLEQTIDDSTALRLTWGRGDMHQPQYVAFAAQILQNISQPPPYTWRGTLALIDSRRQDETWALNLVGKRTTGPIKHNLLFGVMRMRTGVFEQQKRLDLDHNGVSDTASLLTVSPWASANNTNFIPVLPGDFFDRPQAYLYGGSRNAAYVGVVQGAPDQVGDLQRFFVDPFSTGIFISDNATMLQDKLIVLAGARRSYEGSIKRWATTPQIGGLYKLTSHLSVYSMYSETFQSNGLVNPNVRSQGWLEPEKGKGFEAGIKFDFFGGKLTGSAAAFQLKKENVQVNTPQVGPDNLQVRGTYGAQQSDGVEFDALFSPTRALQVIASFSHIDARTTDAAITALTPDSNRDGVADTVGLTNEQAPKYSGSLFVKYSFTTQELKGLDVSAGWKYKAGPYQLFADYGNRLVVQPEDVHVFDARVAYNTKVLGRKIRYSVAVNNIADKRYYDKRALYAAPRWYYFSTDIQF